MNNWEKLENTCYQKLVENYGSFANILPHGKSDSTKPDVEVILPNGELFYIEIKAPNAQCCQFVLFPNEQTKSFDFSIRNKTPKTDACIQIIQHMETLFPRYYKPTQKGIKIDIDTAVLYNLVDEYYSPKLVKFFMTQDKSGNFIIFPSSKFKNYFDITAWYRRKKSGSGEPGEKHIPEITQGLVDYSIKGTVDIIEIDKPRCFLTSDNNGLHKERLICTDFTYEFKTNEHSKKIIPPEILSYVYEIRKLSNTNNPNVICQLELKDVLQDSADLKAFENIFKAAK